MTRYYSIFAKIHENRGSRPKAHPQVHELIADRNDAEAMRTVLSGRAFSYVVDVSGLDLRQAENLTDGVSGMFNAAMHEVEDAILGK